jgi:hypothetical protein
MTVLHLPWRYFLLNLLTLVVASVVVFSHDKFGLFWSAEGEQFRLLVAQQHMWMTPGIKLGSQFVMGAGDMFYPINSTIIPLYAVQIWTLGHVSPVITFTVVAIELFAAVFFFGRSLAFSPVNAAAAAWVVTFLSLPYTPANSLGAPFGYLVPNFPEIVALTALTLALFHKVGKLGTPDSLGRTALITALMVWAFTALPAVIPVAAPVICVYGVGLLITACSRREIYWKLGCGAVGAIVLAGGGFLEFLWSLYAYTAASVFSREMISYQTNLLYGSILFWWKAYSPVGPILFITGAIGALISAVIEQGFRRRFAIFYLGTCALLIVFAVLLHGIIEGYIGINVVYVEFCLWPMYALYATYLLDGVPQLVSIVYSSFIRSSLRKSAARASSHSLYSNLAIGLLPILFGVAATSIGLGMGPGADPGFKNSQRTAFTDILESRIAVAPNLPFRGRVATMSGVNGRDSVGWVDLDLVEQDSKLGNDHRLFGFWKFSIPTLQQNSQFITPSTYLLGSRLLARPRDPQGRNVVVMTQTPVDLLQLLGVRYLVVDDPPPQTVPLASLAWDDGRHRVHLVEVPNPNLGSYSPTQTTTATNAAEALTWMRTQPDFAERAQLFEPLEGPLTKVTRSGMRYVKDGYRVEAEAPARALLVLPIEYSRCLSLHSFSGDTAARLLRSDLMLVAVLFEKHLDARLSLAVGPQAGWNSCRTQDVRDMQQLNYTGAMEAFPLQR